MSEHSLHDAVALVTGGGRRVGAAIARALHGAGMRVVVHHRHSRGEAEALCRELDAVRPDSAARVEGDLLDDDRLPGVVEEARAEFGRLDVLVNNASSFYPTPVGDITQAHWRDLVGTNLKAPLFLSQAAAPYLRAAAGSIVNIVDIYGQHPLREHVVYGVAKAGLMMLTRALARELGPAVRVNAVAPGAVLWPEQEGDHEQRRRVVANTALKRVGAPEDVARAVLYLVRDATFTTGEVVKVDGGRFL